MKKLSINPRLDKALLLLRDVEKIFNDESERIRRDEPGRSISESIEFGCKINDCINMFTSLLSDDVITQVYNRN